MAVGQNKKQSKGYTLIEIIIVVTVLGIMMPAIFSILYAILQQQLKVFRITETKRQGDLIRDFMKEKISRDAASIFQPGPVALCDVPDATITVAGGNTFRFRDDNGNTFWFTQTSGNIRYQDVGIDTVLDTAQIAITNFQIGCIRRRENTIVQFSFIASFNDPSPTAEEGTVSLNYVSKLRLR